MRAFPSAVLARSCREKYPDHAKKIVNFLFSASRSFFRVSRPFWIFQLTESISVLFLFEVRVHGIYRKQAMDLDRPPCQFPVRGKQSAVRRSTWPPISILFRCRSSL